VHAGLTARCQFAGRETRVCRGDAIVGRQSGGVLAQPRERGEALGAGIRISRHEYAELEFASVITETLT